MSTTYRLKWVVSLNNEVLYKSIDDFTERDFNSLIDFLDSYAETCRRNLTYKEKNLDYDVTKYSILFECKDQEMVFILLKVISKLANKKDKTKDTAIALNTVYNTFEIKDILVNGPATIVFWKDGTKTVVQCGSTETYDVEKAVAMCFMKKALGSRSMKKIFDLAEDRAAEYESQFTRLSLKEMGYCLHDALSTILNQNPAKPCEGKIITDPDKIAEKMREEHKKEQE